MIKVHVWLPDAQHVGHTSLEVRDEYISFWPDGAAGKKGRFQIPTATLA